MSEHAPITELREQIEEALWMQAEGKDYRGAPLSIRREILDIAMALVADALRTHGEQVLETVIKACDSEGYIHRSEIRALASQKGAGG